MLDYSGMRFDEFKNRGGDAFVHPADYPKGDRTLDNVHVAEDYLARTTTMYRIIAVGRTCSVPRTELAEASALSTLSGRKAMRSDTDST
jgi:hypothetical protein